MQIPVEQDTIVCLITYLNKGKRAELYKRLDSHKKGLLCKVHQSEKQIDCLDYLIYQIGLCNYDNSKN